MCSNINSHDVRVFAVHTTCKCNRHPLGGGRKGILSQFQSSQVVSAESYSWSGTDHSTWLQSIWVKYLAVCLHSVFGTCHPHTIPCIASWQFGLQWSSSTSPFPRFVCSCDFQCPNDSFNNPCPHPPCNLARLLTVEVLISKQATRVTFENVSLPIQSDG